MSNTNATIKCDSGYEVAFYSRIGIVINKTKNYEKATSYRH